MIARRVCEALFAQTVEACDPALRVRDALVRTPIARTVYGIAIGKAAIAMARGAGPVARGVVVTNADDGRGVPAGWHVMMSSHPEPDERSLAAGDAVIDLVASARKDEHVLVLVSGGASALVERPVEGLSLAQFRDEIRAVMASGVPIHDLNRERIARSAIKGGKLAALSEAPITTLVVSDVFDDDVAIVGSGPTVPPRAADRVEVVAPMRLAAETLAARLGATPVGPLTGWVLDVARSALGNDELDNGETIVGWGEPRIQVPADHGIGGRAQQLALVLARSLRASSLSAFVVGSDGIDGPPPPDRPAPAGAYVDGTTWDAILAAGIDPDRALERCDAGTALQAVGALVITGPTGINHADLIVVG